MDDQQPPEGWTTTRRFARARQSAGIIRSWLREYLLAARVPSNVVDIAELLASEVAANAIEHGAGTEITVRLARAGDVEDVETAVHDEGTTGVPRLAPTTSDDVRGRGLILVQALAISWGTRPSVSGKWVWFRLSADPTPPPPAHRRYP